jgi:hypothetical protein
MKTVTGALAQYLAVGMVTLALTGVVIAGCESGGEGIGANPRNTVNEPYRVPDWYERLELGTTFEEFVAEHGQDSLHDPDASRPGEETYTLYVGGGFMYLSFRDGVLVSKAFVGGP